MPGSTLDRYGQKRDFERTPEPPPEVKAARRGALTFVIQKHSARALHYDFRLELEGVLKSWSVPKGPSLNPADKHLAVMVEDHPLDYASFEGIIPKGEYGGGQVIVWDCGTYSPDEDGVLSFQDGAEAEERMKRGLAAGKLSIFLLGHKLKGSWTLVKMRQGDRNWLLIKHHDKFVDPARDILAEGQSVLSGLTIDDLKGGRLPPAPHPGGLAVRPGELPGARAAQMPATMAPMQASLTDRPFSDPNWIFEPKLDGMRAIALIDGGQVKLLSRNRLDITTQYPNLEEELKGVASGQMILDGEIVAQDAEGRPAFELLQQRMHLTRDEDINRAEAQTPVMYYVFDLLYLDGYDLRAAPLWRRKGLLQRSLPPSRHVRLVEFFEQEGEASYEASVAQGLEGLVAKRRDAVYESGQRSRSWLKVKSTLSDEFIIGGFTEGAGARSASFGALLLGQRDDSARLVYVSNVGSGFSDLDLAGMRERLDSVLSQDCPFSEAPPLKGAAHWVRPVLVAEVKFSSWTGEGSLRAPVFVRLREDKPPAEVVRSEVVSAPEPRMGSETAAPTGPEEEIENVLDRLGVHGDGFILEVLGETLSLSHLDKKLWPGSDAGPALTKRDLLLYLAKVSRYLLPHLKDRPLTLTRYPEGIQGEHFFQKHWDNPLPGFVETVRLFSEHVGGDQEYLLCNNLPTLLWLGQVADLELHTWYSRVDPHPDGEGIPRVFTGSAEAIESSLLNYPDFIVFDVDPYIYSGQEPRGGEPELNRLAFDATRRVALWLKETLDSLSLSSFLKTSGRTGLHIYVPIQRSLDFRATHSIARTVCGFLLKQHPREVTMDWAVARRGGKVFLDYNQNARGKTLASIYSPRAMSEATVSMPLRWEELEGVYPTDFTMLTAPGRLSQVGDLWAGILDAKSDLGALLEKGALAGGADNLSLS
ncbi:MAG: non-homologous end-joining DNA ligase [Dehalococcoidia bacterium]|nr:non-homologous end-joining DNA ligase [Dehalococcoidia bacterium]